MVQYDELKSLCKDMQPKIAELGSAVDVEALNKKISTLEEETNKPDFWNDQKNSERVLKDISICKDKIKKYKNLSKTYKNVVDFIDLADETEDLSVYDDILLDLKKTQKELENQLTETLLGGEYDSNNAILTLHAGAGGTEAQDWVDMLYRMYFKWAEKRDFKFKLLDFLDGDGAGFKSVSFLISGVNAYGYLKSEAGVHRLVRISPFDASGRRHTSFASVEVMPEIDDTIEVEISPDDIKMDFFRASGAGGQHINKTSSAVRVTHIPTGIVVSCQNERSQHQNKEMAMRMLKSKLLEIKEKEHLEKIEDIRGDQKKIEWGSQIRSYVFMPYTMVKDHRTNFEVGNVNSVMDGNIDGFISAYLKMESKNRKQKVKT